jgi:hypothetical protein
MLKELPTVPSRRKCILAVCAYGHKIRALIPHRVGIDQLEHFEAHADTPDQLASPFDEFRALTDVVTQQFGTNTPPTSFIWSYVWSLRKAAESGKLGPTNTQILLASVTQMRHLESIGMWHVPSLHSEEWQTLFSNEARSLSDMVREVYGNPFRPVTFDRAWATDTAKTLARQMYDSREFGALPILADALQDAGCENEHVLTHCRDATQVHVRGCWVCDAVLGRA